MNRLLTYLGTMFGVDTVAGNKISLYYWSTYGLFLIILLLGSLKLPKKAADRLYDRLLQKLLAVSPVWGDSIAFVIRLVWLAMLLLVSVALLVSGSYHPFLSFRF